MDFWSLEGEPPPLRDPLVLREQVLQKLRRVMDPDLGQNIVSLNFVKDLEIDYDNGLVAFTVQLTTSSCPVKQSFAEEATGLLKELGWVENVKISFTTAKLEKNLSNLANVSCVVAVASCKGGVGKSSIACNLAYMLSHLGARVGLVDADVYGPSIPFLVPLDNQDVYYHEQQQRTSGLTVSYEDPTRYQESLISGSGGLLPLVHEKVKLMSYGFLRHSGFAAIRGPLASTFVYQMLLHTIWGDLDYLLIDLPPGTGDVHLTLAQSVPIHAAVIVTTPQHLSITDVEKGILFFNELKIPTIAVVENMSHFICPCCDAAHNIFSDALNAVENLVAKFGIPLHVKIPISNDLARLSFQRDNLFESPQVAADLMPDTQHRKKKQDDEQEKRQQREQQDHQQGEQQDQQQDHQQDKQQDQQQDQQQDHQQDKQQDKRHPSGTRDIFPFVLAFNEDHLIWRTLKSFCESLTQELSARRFGSTRAPQLSVTASGMLEMHLPDEGTTSIFSAPLRSVRLHCSCAECTDEISGLSKLNPRKIPASVGIVALKQKGLYAVHIQWTDKHESLLSFTTLLKIFKEIKIESVGASKCSAANEW